MRRLFKFLLWAVAGIVAAFAVSWVIYMPNGQERGAWRLSTGGYVLYLTPITAALYSETAHSCFEDTKFPAHMKLIEMAEGARVDVVDQQLHLNLDGTLGTLVFDPIEALPEACNATPNPEVDASEVFQAVWTAMDEHYAFFDLHGVNWNERAQFIPEPGIKMTDTELREGLLEMMAGLDDGHIHFGSPEAGWSSPASRPDWVPDDGSITQDGLVQTAIASAGVALTEVDGAPFAYGLRDDGIGYIVLKGMSVDVPFGGNSQDATAEVFDGILNELDDAKALVIDIRYNPGGSDTVSFGIASHFIDEKQIVLSKTTRDGDQQSEPLVVDLAPFGTEKEMRPTLLLTSRVTGSAAEIFTMAMREFPQVTTFGENTSGGLSDVMGFVLPNGWGLGLSNQTYLTVAGELFEGAGIPPDVQMDYETEAYQAGDDPVLAAAFEYINR